MCLFLRFLIPIKYPFFNGDPWNCDERSLFMALQNGRLFSVLKLLFYGRFKTAKKTLFPNEIRLKTWLFFAFQNECFSVVKKRLFYGRFKTAKKTLFPNETRLKTWLFFAFRNECFLVVKKRLFYGRYGMLKKSALYNNSNFLLFFIHYETVKRSYFVTASDLPYVTALKCHFLAISGRYETHIFGRYGTYFLGS